MIDEITQSAEDAASNAKSAIAPDTPGVATDTLNSAELSARQNVLTANLPGSEVQSNTPAEQKTAWTSVPPPPLPTPPPPPPAVMGKGLGGSHDVAKILAEIKLPERREQSYNANQKTPEKKQKIFDTVLGATLSAQNEKLRSRPANNTLSTQLPQEISTQEIGARENKSSSVHSLHTFKDDLQNVVREKKVSLIRVAALEQDKRRGQNITAGTLTEAQIKRRRMMFITMSAAILLLLLGGGALFLVFARMQQNITAVAPVDTSLIFSEMTIPFPIGTLSDVDIKRTLSQARNISGTPIGSITHILPTISQTDEAGSSHEQPATIGEFLKAIGSQTTSDLIRSFRGDFFLGIHTTDERNMPLLIIPVSSYERAFAGMLAWETKINTDLTPIFSHLPLQTTDVKGLPVDRQFQDIVINNYNIRALKDDSGAIQMLYSFPTRDILIIAESQNSFTEILNRLRAKRRL